MARTTACQSFSENPGIALLIVLFALSLFSLLGLFMMLDAETSLRISDNHESKLQASYAALAGLNHAQALLPGLCFDDLLKGPDGVCDLNPSYTAQARTFAFRNLFPLTTALSLDISDPSSALSGVPDDGVISTGYYGGLNGTALIPLRGIAQTAPNPYGPGTIITSRYFVKVTDNNGDPSETARDPVDNPFADGDGMLVVRSIGVARTFSHPIGAIRRNNSVSVFEVRLKRFTAFELGPALVIQGVQVHASMSGDYEISGGEFPAIGTIDADRNDGLQLDQTIRTAPLGAGTVRGGNLASPSVRDISGMVASNREQSLLMDPDRMWKFIHRSVRNAADYFYTGDQHWTDSTAPYLGAYDLSRPSNAPGQDPKVVAVNGNLFLTGSVSGSGVLVVTGDFSCSGSFFYKGLILVIGSGRLILSGAGTEIIGNVYVSNLTDTRGTVGFGAAESSIQGNARITADRDAVRMASGLLPVSRISFREIAGVDP